MKMEITKEEAQILLVMLLERGRQQQHELKTTNSLIKKLQQVLEKCS